VVRRRRVQVVAAVAVALAAATVAGAGLAGAFGRGASSATRATPRASAPAHAPARQVSAGSRKILVLTQTLGYRHASIPAAMAALRGLELVDRRLDFEFLPGAQALTGRRLHSAAAVLFLLTSGELPLGDAGKRRLVEFIRDGGALVGFHSATDTFRRWPGYKAAIGAEFERHALPSTSDVVVEDRANPATRLLPARFQIHEEFYEFATDPRPRTHVLARLDAGVHGPDRPLVWCRRDGRGRVFYDALGHFSETWRDSRQLDIALGGIEWAAGLARARC
jgi:uncharacterized protein